VNMKIIKTAAILLLFVVNFLYSAPSTQQSASTRIQPSDLTYLGAFRLPDGEAGSDVRNWWWGGYAMTYYPDGDPTGPNDGYPGSIFGCGHAWEYQVSEISIPVPIISASKNINQLNTATTLQSFHDILDVGDREMPRAGLEYLPKQGSQTSDKLYFCYGQHLIDGTDMTHGWCELNLSNPQIQKGWYLDTSNSEYNTNDYMFEIPSNWASVNTPGKLLATGRFRDGGWSGQGPTVYAISPWTQGNPPAPGTSLQYTTLLKYTSTNDPDSWEESTNHTMDNYHNSDEWSGAVWLTSGNKSAVLFAGTKGTGDCWYGDSNGPCYDCEGERGWWSTGFVGQFIFYDPDDLAKVAAGTMEPWEPQPYATLNIDQYLYHIESTQQWYHLGAASFDRTRGYLYVFEPLVDDDKPIVHVWKLASTSTTPMITVTSPNGGENWQGGANHTITWTSSGTVGNVKIDFSSDNGSTWSTIITSTANDGTYTWTVPNVSSSQCLVRIEETDGSPSDTSNSVFSISSGGGTSAWISLNRERLNFGGTVNGSSPAQQTFFIDNSGSGTLNWTLSDNADWLSCSPLSGSGPGQVTVSVNLSNITSGQYNGIITISSSNANNSPQTLNVTLNVYEQGLSSPPFGQFATPTDNSTVMSSIPVTGWVVDDIGVDSVKIYRQSGNGLIYIGDAVFVEGARPDVELAYPDYPMNYRAGWGYMMLTNFLPGSGNGTFTLYAIATDREGYQVTLGSKNIICDNANAIKPFGAIDTPSQGGNASGNNFINWGWVLTPQPNYIPTNGSTINVYVDGVNLGHPNYDIYRSDIAELFPGYSNSNGAAGFFTIDTTAYENGLHTIQWTASDNAGNSDGIGSRYFTIQNSSNRTSAAHQLSLNNMNVNPFDIPANLYDYNNPLNITRGYNNTKQSIFPNEKGLIEIKIKELEPIQIYLSGNKGIENRNENREIKWSGFMIKGDHYAHLPTGSTLDKEKGIYYWIPPHGFLGTYQLLFIHRDKRKSLTRQILSITILPKF